MGYFHRLVNIGGQGLDVFQPISVISSVFPDYYRRLIRRESVQCQITGTTFPAIRSPTAVILDVRMTSLLFDLIFSNVPSNFTQTVVSPALPAIRTLTGRTVPIFAWNPGSAFTMLRFFGPEELGGLSDVLAKAHVLAEATGREIEGIVDEVTILFAYNTFQFLIKCE